jgi:hypothetical protein
LNAEEQNPIVSIDRALEEETVMIRTTRGRGTLPTPARPVVLRVVRHDGPVVIARQKPQRPAWSLLYAIVPLTLAGLVAIEFLLPEGPARTAAELLAVLGCIALVRLWIGWNRWSLVRTGVPGQPGLQEQAADVPSTREVAS